MLPDVFVHTLSRLDHRGAGARRCMQFHAQQGGVGLSPVDMATSIIDITGKGSDPGTVQVTVSS